MTTLIDKREERTKERKKFKKAIDDMIKLSHDGEMSLSTSAYYADDKIRLLDEGAVVGDGFVDCYIKKGTLEKFLNGENEYLENMQDDFVGSVNLGHMGFAQFPFIIGEFTKDNIHLVDLGDDRKALDIDLVLDRDSVFVRELARMPYDISVSSEFYYHADQEATMEYGFLVIDEVFIKAYALVGEPGNVNSDGLRLGVNMPTDKEITLETEVTLEKEEEIATCDAICEEVEEESKEEATSEEAVSEEAISEEVADEEDTIEQSFDRLQDAYDEMAKQFEAITAENEELKSKLEAFTKKNKKLQRKLDNKCEEIDTFTSKFKGLSVSMGLSEDENEVKRMPNFKGNNGIGEL